MIDLNERILPVEITNSLNNRSINYKAILDTGASNSCIPNRIVQLLDLKPIGLVKVYTAVGENDAKMYFINIKIKDSIYKVKVVGFEGLDIALIGWDILSNNKIFSLMFGTVFDQTISFLSIIPEIKKNVVLILGQDTTEIHRLYLIRETLNKLGYQGIIVKEIKDIELQTIEEKVNMLASLSRFIICDNSFASGHIDELKICWFNRFTTAIIQEEGKGATWMQADYSIDINTMKTFKYPDFSKIPEITKKAITWAENHLKTRTEKLNSLYTWRTT
jgi:hypothetical protein